MRKFVELLSGDVRKRFVQSIVTSVWYKIVNEKLMKNIVENTQQFRCHFYALFKTLNRIITFPY